MPTIEETRAILERRRQQRQPQQAASWDWNSWMPNAAPKAPAPPPAGYGLEEPTPEVRRDEAYETWRKRGPYAPSFRRIVEDTNLSPGDKLLILGQYYPDAPKPQSATDYNADWYKRTVKQEYIKAMTPIVKNKPRGEWSNESLPAYLREYAAETQARDEAVMPALANMVISPLLEPAKRAADPNYAAQQMGAEASSPLSAALGMSQQFGFGARVVAGAPIGAFSKGAVKETLRQAPATAQRAGQAAGQAAAGFGEDVLGKGVAKPVTEAMAVRGEGASLSIKKFPDAALQSAYDTAKKKAADLGMDLTAVQGVRPDDYWVHLELPKQSSREPYWKFTRAVADNLPDDTAKRLDALTRVSKGRDNAFLPFRTMEDAQAFLATGDMNKVARKLDLGMAGNISPSKVSRPASIRGKSNQPLPESFASDLAEWNELALKGAEPLGNTKITQAQARGIEISGELMGRTREDSSVYKIGNRFYEVRFESKSGGHFVKELSQGELSNIVPEPKPVAPPAKPSIPEAPVEAAKPAAPPARGVPPSVPPPSAVGEPPLKPFFEQADVDMSLVNMPIAEIMGKYRTSSATARALKDEALQSYRLQGQGRMTPGQARGLAAEAGEMATPELRLQAKQVYPDLLEDSVEQIQAKYRLTRAEAVLLKQDAIDNTPPRLMGRLGISKAQAEQLAKEGTGLPETKPPARMPPTTGRQVDLAADSISVIQSKLGITVSQAKALQDDARRTADRVKGLYRLSDSQAKALADELMWTPEGTPESVVFGGGPPFPMEGEHAWRQANIGQYMPRFKTTEEWLRARRMGQGQTAAGGAGRGAGGPTGTATGASGMGGPSGADSYQRMQSALRLPVTPLNQKIRQTRANIMRQFYTSWYPLRKLSKQTGVRADYAAQLLPGKLAAYEDELRREIRPLYEHLGKHIRSLEEYMGFQRMYDILDQNPAAKLPGGVQGRGAVDAGLNFLKQKVGQEAWDRIEAAAQALWQKRDELVLTRMKDEGLISDAAFQELKTKHPRYIPFFRRGFDEAVYGSATGGTKADVATSGLRHLDFAGSERTLKEPLASFEASIIQLNMRIERNRVAKKIVEALRASNPALARVVKNPVHDDLWDTIRYMEGGQVETVQVPREFAEVAKNLDWESSNVIINVMNKLGQPLRAGAVTYNPAFVVVNPIRDGFSAWFREGVVPFVGKDYIKGMVAAFTRNQLFTDAAQNAVLMSGIVENMTSATAMSKVKRLQLGKVFGLKFSNPMDIPLNLPRFIERLNMIGEQGTRIATYSKLRAEGMDAIEAAVRARDVTVDFAKAGTTMRMVNMILPFSNAALQGTANTYRMLVQHPGRALLAASPFVAVSVFSRLNNLRYDTSDQIPDYEYRQNWVFQFGEFTKTDGTRGPLYFKIPKGPLGALLTFPAEAVFNYQQKTSDKTVVEFALQAARDAAIAALPIEPTVSGITPPLLGTGVSMALNKDLYTGRDIVPLREQRLVEEQRFGQETSTVAIAIGRKAGVSPRLIDFAIKDYLAGTGQFGSWVSDAALDAVGYEKPEPFGIAKEEQMSDIERISRYPGASRFIGTKATQAEREGMETYQDAVAEAQREFNKFPDVNRLGISMTQVGDTIEGIELLPADRAIYQGFMADKINSGLGDVFNSPEYLVASDKLKTELITKAKSKLGDVARLEMLQYMDEEGKLDADGKKKFNRMVALYRANNKLATYDAIADKEWAKYPPELRAIEKEIRRLENTGQDRKARELGAQYPNIYNILREIDGQKRWYIATYPKTQDWLDVRQGATLQEAGVE